MKYLAGFIASFVLLALLPAYAGVGDVFSNIDPVANVSAGKCIADRNNLELDDCHQLRLAVETPVNDNVVVGLNYTRLDADVTGLNGAADARGDYDREEWALSADYHFDKTFFGARPYAGAEVGYGGVSTDFAGTADIDSTTAVFADDEFSDVFWGVKAGANLALTEYTAGFIETGYRSYGRNGFDARFQTQGGSTGQLQPDGVQGIDRSYEIRVGVRIKLFN